MTLLPYTADHVDALQEIVNVAMGRAGASLATLARAVQDMARAGAFEVAGA